jgi:Recombination endonuclease VII
MASKLGRPSHMKRCSHCREYKERSEFHRGSGPDGLHRQCKACRSACDSEARARREGSRNEGVALAEQGLRRCTACREVKPLDDFYRKAASTVGRKSQCIPCYSERVNQRNQTPEARAGKQRAYRRQRDADPDEFRRRQREYALRYKYGLEWERFEAMLKRQDHRCAICGGSEPLVHDHDHDTGASRGLLCRRCNAGLGMFGDNLGLLEAATAYLRAPKLAEVQTA